MKKTGPRGPSEPIRDKEVIATIKKNLAGHPRDFCLFILGVNTAFRASDILSLNVGDVRNATEVNVVEQKTGKRRIVPLNAVCQAAILPLVVNREDDEPLFVGEKRGTRLTVETLCRLWKRWCADAGLHGRYASHSGRKSFGYHRRKEGAPLELLVKAYGHSSAAVTLQYLGITDDEIRGLYSNAL